MTRVQDQVHCLGPCVLLAEKPSGVLEHKPDALTDGENLLLPGTQSSEQRAEAADSLCPAGNLLMS